MSIKFIIQKYGITLFLAIYISFCLLHYLNLINYDFFNSFSNSFFNDILPNFLDTNEGTLVSLAAILIGIYFTIFTLLGTVKLESTISLLTEKSFSTLVEYIKRSFIWTFIYVIFVLLVPNTEKHNLPSYFYMLNSIMLLYILLSAYRFANIMYNSFKFDIKNFERLKQEQIKLVEDNNELKVLLTDFLNSEKEKKDIVANETLDKFQIARELENAKKNTDL